MRTPVFDEDHLVQLLEEGWKREKKPLAHNWRKHVWPIETQWIRHWCKRQDVDWGALPGYPVLQAQRREMAEPKPRIARWKRLRANKTISRMMFSLARSHNAEAFRTAESFARSHGFVPHPYDPDEPI